MAYQTQVQMGVAPMEAAVMGAAAAVAVVETDGEAKTARPNPSSSGRGDS
jgi:hypothetical protein